MSAAGIEGVVAETWIYQRLANDAGLAELCPGGVHEGVAGDTLPAVVFQVASPPTDTGAFPTARALTEGVWTVRVVGETSSYTELAPAARRIDQLLHGSYGRAAGGVINGCVRTGVVQYGDEDSGRSFRHLGGLYRISVS